MKKHSKFNILPLVILGILTATISASDLIIDRAGNEILAKVVSVSGHTVTYSLDTTAPAAAQQTIAVADVFMIKYASGEKKVFPAQAAAATPVPLAEHSRCDVSISGNGGVFGLFNVDNVFTKASYTIGFTPVFRYALSSVFSLGAEVMVLWGSPKLPMSCACL